MPFEVREINRIDGLDPYRQTWMSLLAETPGANFFQTLVAEKWTCPLTERKGTVPRERLPCRYTTHVSR